MTNIKRPLAISQMTKVSFEMYKLTERVTVTARYLPRDLARGRGARSVVQRQSTVARALFPSCYAVILPKATPHGGRD
jgi:hypothetical protein